MHLLSYLSALIVIAFYGCGLGTAGQSASPESAVIPGSEIFTTFSHKEPLEPSEKFNEESIEARRIALLFALDDVSGLRLSGEGRSEAALLFADAIAAQSSPLKYFKNFERAYKIIAAQPFDENFNGFERRLNFAHSVAQMSITEQSQVSEIYLEALNFALDKSLYGLAYSWSESEAFSADVVKGKDPALILSTFKDMWGLLHALRLHPQRSGTLSKMGLERLCKVIAFSEDPQMSADNFYNGVDTYLDEGWTFKEALKLQTLKSNSVYF